MDILTPVQANANDQDELHRATQARLALLGGISSATIVDGHFGALFRPIFSPPGSRPTPVQIGPPGPEAAAYNMSKREVVQLGKTMAVELATYQINVNVVNPGWIDTPNTRMYVGGPAVDEGGRRVPSGRLGVPKDIGKAVAYLASDDADYVTGTALLVDGGPKMGLRLHDLEGLEKGG